MTVMHAYRVRIEGTVDPVTDDQMAWLGSTLSAYRAAAGYDSKTRRIWVWATPYAGTPWTAIGLVTDAIRVWTRATGVTIDFTQAHAVRDRDRRNR